MPSQTSFAPQPEMVQTTATSMQPDLSISTPQDVMTHINMAYDWTGPDDPDNPRNFSLPMKAFSIGVVTILAFISAFAGAVYAPAQNDVMESFHLTGTIAVLPLSLYNLGMAFGPVIGAPLSETYGRRFVLLLTTPAFIVFVLGAGFSTNIVSLIMCRFFAGMFAAPNINNASATILDYVAPQYRGISLGIYYSIPSLGASIAPLTGGFIVESQGWRWTQWISAAVAAVFYIPALFTKESYKKVVLRNRAIAMGLSDTSSQRMSLKRALRHFFTTLILRPLHMLFTEPIVGLVSLYNGFIFGLLYTFVISVPWTFRTYYGFDKLGESLSYLGVTIGTLAACVPFAFIDVYYYQKRLLRWQETHGNNEPLAPENRLVSSMIGSAILPASLFVAGWTANGKIHWVLPVIFQGMSMLGSLLVYAGVNLFMLDAYGPLYGASASGAMMLSRYFLSFAFPLFALQMFESLGVGWATSILGFCTVLLMPIPWYFRVCGKNLRGKSRYEGSI